MSACQVADVCLRSALEFAAVLVGIRLPMSKFRLNHCSTKESPWHMSRFPVWVEAVYAKYA